jgi:hypothetical protein
VTYNVQLTVATEYSQIVSLNIGIAGSISGLTLSSNAQISGTGSSQNINYWVNGYNLSFNYTTGATPPSDQKLWIQKTSDGILRLLSGQVKIVNYDYSGI